LTSTKHAIIIRVVTSVKHAITKYFEGEVINMYLYEVHYFEKCFRNEHTFYANSLQQAITYVRKLYNISDYDMKLSQKENERNHTSDYTLYKHTTKTTYFLNNIA
jgi:hypothetical protein